MSAVEVFACGCNLADKLASGYTRRVINGQERCPEHDEPVRNWRSIADRERDRIMRNQPIESDGEVESEPVVCPTCGKPRTEREAVSTHSERTA